MRCHAALELDPSLAETYRTLGLSSSTRGATKKRSLNTASWWHAAAAAPAQISASCWSACRLAGSRSAGRSTKRGSRRLPCAACTSASTIRAGAAPASRAVRCSCPGSRAWATRSCSLPALASSRRSPAAASSPAIAASSRCSRAPFPQRLSSRAPRPSSAKRLARETVDFQLPAGSLPLVFRARREDFPPHAGYLRADPARVIGARASPRSAAGAGSAFRGAGHLGHRPQPPLDRARRAAAAARSVRHPVCQPAVRRGRRRAGGARAQPRDPRRARA